MFASAVNATARPAGASPVRARRLARLAESLPPDEAVLARNRAITQTYANWSLAHLALCQWAGMAAYAATQVWAFLTFRGRSGASLWSRLDRGLLQRVEEPIGQTNNAVFADIGWAHLAYLAPDGGIREVESGLADLRQTHGELLAAFRRLDDAWRAWDTGGAGRSARVGGRGLDAQARAATRGAAGVRAVAQGVPRPALAHQYRAVRVGGLEVQARQLVLAPLPPPESAAAGHRPLRGSLDPGGPDLQAGRRPAPGGRGGGGVRPLPDQRHPPVGLHRHGRGSPALSPVPTAAPSPDGEYRRAGVAFWQVLPRVLPGAESYLAGGLPAGTGRRRLRLPRRWHPGSGGRRPKEVDLAG